MNRVVDARQALTRVAKGASDDVVVHFTLGAGDGSGLGS